MVRCRPTCWIGFGSWKVPSRSGVREPVPLSIATLARIPQRLALSVGVLPLFHRHLHGGQLRTVPQALHPAAPSVPNGISTTPSTISCISNTTTWPMSLPSPDG